jgi:hypothetical protein
VLACFFFPALPILLLPPLPGVVALPTSLTCPPPPPVCCCCLSFFFFVGVVNGVPAPLLARLPLRLRRCFACGGLLPLFRSDAAVVDMGECVAEKPSSADMTRPCMSSIPLFAAVMIFFCSGDSGGESTRPMK